MCCGSALYALALPLVVSSFISAVAPTGVPNWLAQSWYFDWTPPGAPLPVPITAQCETIHVAWTRGTASGPDPVAPYYLQIYTSNYIFPFIISAGPDPHTDLTIPFAPGSQYEICMFDSNGNTGGCQAIYTVYSNSNTSSTPICANFTMPATTLSVKSEYAQGALSMYGWVDSCSDIRVTPQGGTPPFTFTVAPALHPPLNITSNDMSPINWTVSLSWGSPFFISLVDSTGLSWSNGPIHSGDGQTNCLAKDFFSNGKQGMAGATVGAAVGGVAFGSIASLFAALLISRRRATIKRRGLEREPIPFTSTDHSRYESVSSQSPPADRQVFPFQQQPLAGSKPRSVASLGSIATLSGQYNIEPFQYDASTPFTTPNAALGSDPTATMPQQSWNNVLQGTHARTASGGASMSIPDRQEGRSQVYVIHHDSGRAPVSVITSRGTEVVELPPGYSSEYLSTASGSQSSASSQRRHGKAATGSG